MTSREWATDLPESVRCGNVRRGNVFHRGPKRRKLGLMKQPSGVSLAFRSACLASRFACLVLGIGLCVAPEARATVNQPTGEPMPQPAAPSEIACCVVGRGFPADADTLAGLFAYHQFAGVAGGDATIDPIADAHTTPGTFSPQCGLSGTIVLHGGGCKNALGWYNATENPATVPTTIYPLVPANLTLPPPNGISCVAGDFCPLATRMTTQPQYTWADPLPDFAANIRSDKNWAGGLVGFALIGVPNGQCPQTKYSQAELDNHSPAGPPTNGAPWVTTLIYQSVADPSGYYIAFEDQPTCMASWRGCNPGSQTQALVAPNGNDGDFNDFVFYVTGIDCEGGGVPCDTGMPGVCSSGTKQCANGGMSFTCRPNVAASTEVCNGLDDDCDGVVDNPTAPGLCPTGQVCTKGVCRFACSASEFPCSPPFVCDSADRVCKEQACVGVACDPGKICRNGQCVGGCNGVTCPVGLACVNGLCLDLCKSITCDASEVCENGGCVSPCGCRNCPSGKTCSAGGTCVDTGCDKVTCNPPATVCVAGQCQDGCQGVVCPTGQACSGGVCSEVDAGTIFTVPDGGTSTTGGGGSSGTTTGGGGSSGTGATGATGAKGGSSGGATSGGHEGGVCKCDTSDGPSGRGVVLLSRSSRWPWPVAGARSSRHRGGEAGPRFSAAGGPPARSRRRGRPPR